MGGIEVTFRIPEIFLGVLLAVALIAIGAVIGSIYLPNKIGSSEAISLWAWLRKDASGFFTLGLVIVGAVQLALFAWQLNLLRRSVDEGRIAAIAARDGAVAARDNADVAKLSMVASDRAYIHYNGCRWISHHDNSDGHVFWRVRAIWINSGNTPTRKMKVHVERELRDDELPLDFPFASPEQAPKPVSIAPKGTIESGYFDIDGSDLVAVATGSKHLYIWGVARYRDVFPETAEHVTKFCVHARAITGNPMQGYDAKANIMDILFAHHFTHNCADEDCGS